MAIYSTFFVYDPAKLLSLFPAWRPPLPEPVLREFRNPFTGQVTQVSTREPEWLDEDDDLPTTQAESAAIHPGGYLDYLEARLPEPVCAQPHWCSKGLTQVELEPLGRAAGVDRALEAAFYSPPSSGSLLDELHPALISKLTSADENALREIAECWAATMSARGHTHSATGVKLADGWTTEDAMNILGPIVDLARKMSNDQRLYLLVEA